MASYNQKEQATSPSPLTETSSDSSKSLSEEKKKNPKRKRSPSPSNFSISSELTCRKCGSNKDDLDDYKVDRLNKRPRDVKKLKTVNMHCAEAPNYKNYRSMEQSQEYTGHISGKIAMSAKRMDVQMNSAVFKPSDPILIISFLRNFKTARE